MATLTRRDLLGGALAGAASLALPRTARACADGDLAPVYAEIEKRHSRWSAAAR